MLSIEPMRFNCQVDLIDSMLTVCGFKDEYLLVISQKHLVVALFLIQTSSAQSRTTNVQHSTNKMFRDR